MVASKLTKEDCEHIAKLIEEGHQIKDLAKRYGIDRSTIYNRCKYLYKSRKIPVETKKNYQSNTKRLYKSGSSTNV